jgi:hypothetical protein
MPRIIIDTEVYEALADRARAWRDTPNDVLRALLGLPPIERDAITPDAEPLPGQLGPLIRAGLLKPGERITWHRRNHADTYTFTVTAMGFLTDEDGTEYIGPNRAATRIAGYPTKGWPVFKTASGTALADLAASIANPTHEP